MSRALRTRPCVIGYTNILSVQGSRTLFDPRVKILILEAIELHDVKALVTSGEPPGVCQVCRELAKEYAIPLTLHYLDFKRKRGAFEHRGKAILQSSDHCLFIHDGKSRGTLNEMNIAKALEHPYTYHCLDFSSEPSNTGFDVTDEWWPTSDPLSDFLADTGGE